MYLSLYTLFVFPLLGLFVSAAPVADQSPGVGLVVETTADWAPHRYMRRSQGGGGGGIADWKRALDNSLLLRRSGEHDGR